MGATFHRTRVGTAIVVGGFALLVLGFPAKPVWGYACTAMIPQVNLVQPSSAPPGSMVAINVTYAGSFDCLAEVTFGDTPSPVATWDGQATVVAEVPPRPAGSAPIRVTFHVGGQSDPADFEVLSGSPPPPTCTEALPVVHDVTPRRGFPSGWTKITVAYDGDWLCFQGVIFGDTPSPVATWDGVVTVMAQVPEREPGYAPILVDMGAGGMNDPAADFWVRGPGDDVPSIGGWGFATLTLLLLGAVAYAFRRRG